MAASAAVVVVKWFYFFRSQLELWSWVPICIVCMWMKWGELCSKIHQMRRDFGNRVRTIAVVLFGRFWNQDYFQFQIWRHDRMCIDNTDMLVYLHSWYDKNILCDDNICVLGGGDSTANFVLTNFTN